MRGHSSGLTVPACLAGDPLLLEAALGCWAGPALHRSAESRPAVRPLSHPAVLFSIDFVRVLCGSLPGPRVTGPSVPLATLPRSLAHPLTTPITLQAQPKSAW